MNETLDILTDCLSHMKTYNCRHPCELEGGAFCANISIPPDGVPWIQVKCGVINLYYPFWRSPKTIFSKYGLDDLKCIAYPACDRRTFATITFTEPTLDELARYINRLFLSLYDLSEGYRIQTDIIDLR